MNRSAQLRGDWRDVALLAVFTIMLALFALIALACQFVWPTFISARIHFGCLLACALFLIFFVRVGEFQRAKAILYSLFLTFGTLLWFFPMSSRQPFLRDLDKVQIGMTRAQVESIMGGYIKGTGWPALPFASEAAQTLTNLGSGSHHKTQTNSAGEIQISGAITYRHSEEGEYNSDWGVVSFSNGRVSQIEFMPD